MLKYLSHINIKYCTKICEDIYYHHTGWNVIFHLSSALGGLPQVLVMLVGQERFGQLSQEQLETAGQNMNLPILVTFLERFPFPLQSLLVDQHQISTLWGPLHLHLQSNADEEDPIGSKHVQHGKLSCNKKRF